MRLRHLHLTSDRALSVSAIVIAVVSIGVAVWESSEVRKHNRLSVRPRLELTYANQANRFGYVVTNNGLGPALITGKKILVDNQEVEDIYQILDSMNLEDRDYRHDVVNPGSTVRAGEQRTVLFMDYLPGDNRDSLLFSVYQRVGMEITYESMYEEPYICTVGNR